MDRARTLDLANRPKPTARARAGRVPNLGLVSGSSLRGRHTCSVAVAGDEPPNEFRIFTAGAVVTTKGTFTFDDAAARAVMADYAAHGIDVMIDYDHAALASMPVDPALSGKAAGWFNLELRDGELWAVNVRWTEPAAEALRAKEWRFMSPAFNTDDKGHVTSLLNVAITNLPATRNLEPLMAASRARDLRTLSVGPAFSDVQMALCAALDAQYPSTDQTPYEERPWITDVFDASVVYQMSGAFYEAPYTFDGSAASLGAPVEVKRSYAPIQAPAAPAAENTTTHKLSAGGSMDPKLIGEALDALIAGDSAKCEELLKSLVASAAGATPADKPADKPAGDKPPEPPPDMKADDKPAEIAAASARLMRLSGKTSFVDAISEVETWRTSHIETEAIREKLAKEQAALELGKRKENAITLTRLGAETPHTSGLADGKLCPRLLAEPLEEQTARVAALLSARGGKLPDEIRPPVGGTVELSARELAMCAEKKIDPKDYAARKALKKG